MTITTLAGFQAARRQRVPIVKASAAGTGLAGPVERLISCATSAGNPGALTIAGLTDTASGALQSNTTAGYPALESFGGMTGYLVEMEAASHLPAALNLFHAILYDNIYVAGTYAFNANTTLASQPSISGRVPNGDYGEVELWWQAATGFTGTPSVAVTYTDQSGNTGHTTGTIALGTTNATGTIYKLPLANGDWGVQKIESVVGSGASAGTFNLMLVRRLAIATRLGFGVPPARKGILQLGAPMLYDTSCLLFAVNNAPTASTISISALLTIAMG